MNYELQDKLFTLNSLIHKWNAKIRADRGVMGDIYRGQGRLLEFLKIKDGISTRDLSYFLGMRISSLNELLAKLERSGHITREPSDEDKRIMLIYLTDSGRGAEGLLEETDMFSSFTEEEQLQLSDYLTRIIQYMETELGNSNQLEEVSRWQEDVIDRLGIDEYRRIIEMNSTCGHGRRRAESECCGGGHGHHGEGHGHGHHGEGCCGEGQGKGHGHHDEGCCGEGQGKGHGHHGEECCGGGHGKGHGHHGEECCGGGHGKGHHRHDEYTHGGKYLGNQGNECGCEI